MPPSTFATDRRAGRARLGATPSEPLAIGGRVYVGTKDPLLLPLHSSSGRIEDHRRVAAELLGRVAVTDQHVYFATLDNTVNAVLRRDGALRWHQGVLYRPGAGPVVLGDFVIVPGYVEAPLPAFSATTGAAAGAVSFGGLLVALPLFATLPDGRDAAIGIIGGLENKWMVTLRRRRSSRRSRCSRLRCCPEWWWRSCRLACDARAPVPREPPRQAA